MPFPLAVFTQTMIEPVRPRIIQITSSRCRTCTRSTSRLDTDPHRTVSGDERDYRVRRRSTVAECAASCSPWSRKRTRRTGVFAHRAEKRRVFHPVLRTMGSFVDVVVFSQIIGKGSYESAFTSDAWTAYYGYAGSTLF